MAKTSITLKTDKLAKHGNCESGLKGILGSLATAIVTDSYYYNMATTNDKFFALTPVTSETISKSKMMYIGEEEEVVFPGPVNLDFELMSIAEDMFYTYLELLLEELPNITETSVITFLVEVGGMSSLYLDLELVVKVSEQPLRVTSDTVIYVEIPTTNLYEPCSLYNAIHDLGHAVNSSNFGALLADIPKYPLLVNSDSTTYMFGDVVVSDVLTNMSITYDTCVKPVSRNGISNMVRHADTLIHLALEGYVKGIILATWEKFYNASNIKLHISIPTGKCPSVTGKVSVCFTFTIEV